jgi:hypothetical protein
MTTTSRQRRSGHCWGKRMYESVADHNTEGINVSALGYLFLAVFVLSLFLDVYTFIHFT